MVVLVEHMNDNDLRNISDGDYRRLMSEAYPSPKKDIHAAVMAQVMEEATLNACKAPVEMVRCCGKALDLLAEMLEKGSKMLISDVGCGALLCKAAMESAALNVFVNTGTLTDRETAAKLEA